MLFSGAGTVRGTDNLFKVISTVAGTGDWADSVSSGNTADQTNLDWVEKIAIGHDGSVYFAQSGFAVVQKVSPEGVVTTVADIPEQWGSGGDGGPATEATLSYPWGLDVGPDGSLYITDIGNDNVRRVTPDGIITTVAGSGIRGFSGDGGPATLATLNDPTDIAVGPDCTLYIVDSRNNRVRRVGPDGNITTYAGNGTRGFGGDSGPAVEAALYYPQGVAVAPDGSVYIADTSNNRVRRVGLDGVITTVVGTGYWGYPIDGGPAIEQNIGWPTGIAIGKDGSIYVAVVDNKRLIRVDADGTLATVAGTGDVGYSGDGGPATAATVRPYDVAIDPDGNIHVADTENSRIRKISNVMPGFSVEDFLVPSSDGSEIHVFDKGGRHLRTLDALTGVERYTFSYDDKGLLLSATDMDGDVTTIERDVDGSPRAIVGPDNHRTLLTLDDNGYLSAITEPDGAVYRMEYTEQGLMTGYTDPKGNHNSYAYDAWGRLVEDVAPNGGGWTLSHEDSASTATTHLTSGEGRTNTYQVELLPGGDRRQMDTNSDGTVTTTINSRDGVMLTTLSDGMVISEKSAPDPRFGMQAPITESLTMSTPSGLTMSIESNHTTTLADAINPLSLTSLTKSISINGRTTSREYDSASKTWTNTSAGGRVATLTTDDKGRPILSQVTGMEPASFGYDSRGRVNAIMEGTGAEARITSITYDNQGNLDTVTDAEGRSVAFDYDLVGRITRQELPDGREITYDYDDNGNLVSLIPVGHWEMRVLSVDWKLLQGNS